MFSQKMKLIKYQYQHNRLAFFLIIRVRFRYIIVLQANNNSLVVSGFPLNVILVDVCEKDDLPRNL